MIETPLEIEIAMIDLRYHENEFRRGNKFPSISELQKRWGWGRNKVKKALSGGFGHWRSPYAKATLKDMRASSLKKGSFGTGKKEPAPQKERKGVPSKTSEPEELEEIGPKNTKKENPSTVEPGKVPSRVPSKTSEPEELEEIGPVRGPVNLNAASFEADFKRGNKYKQEYINILSVPPIASQEQHGGDGELLFFPSMKPKERAPLQKPEIAIYQHWHKYHKSAFVHPGKDTLKHILNCYEAIVPLLRKNGAADPAVAAEQLLKSLIDYIHLSPECTFFQGVNKKGPNGTGKKYLGVVTIFNKSKLSGRIERVRKWLAKGAPINENIDGQRYIEEAAVQWQNILDCTFANRLPERLHPRAAQENAARAALQEVPFSEIGRSTDRELPQLRRQFIDAYCKARGVK